jgi:hypothetical protein
LLILTVASFGLTPVAPFGRVENREAECFNRLAQHVGFLGEDVQACLRGESILARKEIFLVVYGGPLLGLTATFVSLLVVLARHQHELGPTVPTVLFRWAVLFGILALPASPVLVQDFWLSAGWGRMVAAGQNPYHTDLTPEITDGLPLDYFGQRMTYGPLWAAVAGALMWAVGGSVIAAAAAFKLLLLAAWTAALYLIRLLLRASSIWAECIGLAIFGWLPLSVTQTVSDGHNDVLMVLFLLTWLYCLNRAWLASASVALAASVCVKYVTAPLFLLHFFYMLLFAKPRQTNCILQAVAVLTVLTVSFGLFFRSPDFFASTTVMADWHFLTPKSAMLELGDLTSLNLGLLATLAQILFPVLAAWAALRYVAVPTPSRFHIAVLAMMCGILFSVVGHVWPWFVLWPLSLAALVPDCAWARWVLGAALAAPFAVLVLFLSPPGSPNRYTVPTLLLYGLTVGWFVLMPRRWLVVSSL